LRVEAKRAMFVLVANSLFTTNNRYDFFGVTSEASTMAFIEQARSLKGLAEHEEEAAAQMAESGQRGDHLPASALMMGVVKTCFTMPASGVSGLMSLSLLVVSVRRRASEASKP